jgi:hypothetical protein
MMAAVTVEMNLELAQRFTQMQLPAALIPAVLETAMQDFVDQVDTADPNDRMPIIWYPRTITPTTLQDYIAATVTLDGPLVSADQSPTVR